MYVIDEITGEKIPIGYSIKVIIDYSYNIVIFGYIHRDNIVSSFKLFINNEIELSTYVCKKAYKGNLIFSNRYGCYTTPLTLTELQVYEHINTKGRRSFPYNFDKTYEAIDHFDIFRNKQLEIDDIDFKLSKYLKYTIGVEFETSCGYIPEDRCFELGLIPLRDGSIFGLEYSSVILEGNKGLNLLYQQLLELKDKTRFDKECSLHFHFGNFSLDSDKIYRIYLIWYKIQEDIRRYVPPLTFNSEVYKNNGKSYCKKLPKHSSFESLYKHLVGTHYYGNLFQSHPKDVERKRKWQITTRYYALNLINILCYNVNKTIEFRFLRPTYNFNKIILWLYIFNAMLLYAEGDYDINDCNSIEDIITTIYPEDLSEDLIIGLNKLERVVIEQISVGDHIGNRTDIENKEFSIGIFYI